MPTPEIIEQVKRIKQSFRGVMNGVTARSMREKGTGYRLNWGASFPDLEKMAAEYGKNYELAIELWKEDVRECKILAAMLMPPGRMIPEVAEIWMEQISTQELAEITAYYLFQYLDYAPALAFRWMASDSAPFLISAYSILSRLFANKMEINDRGVNEFLDQANVALHHENAGVRHAVLNCVQRFAGMKIGHAYMVRHALNLDFL